MLRVSIPAIQPRPLGNNLEQSAFDGHQGSTLDNLETFLVCKGNRSPSGEPPVASFGARSALLGARHDKQVIVPSGTWCGSQLQTEKRMIDGRDVGASSSAWNDVARRIEGFTSDENALSRPEAEGAGADVALPRCLSFYGLGVKL